MSVLICFFQAAIDTNGCIACPREFDNNLIVKRPTKDTFNRYLPFFFEDLPTDNCAKAGRAAYSQVSEDAVHFFDSVDCNGC